MDFLTNVDIILILGLLLLISSFFSVMTLHFFKKTAIWYAVKAIKFDSDYFIKAIIIIISASVFLFSFLNAGALVFFSIFPFLILTILGVATFLFSPIVLGAILERFLFNKENFSDIKNILFANTYLLLLFLLPFYIGLILYFILFVYVFGISSILLWNMFINNHN